MTEAANILTFMFFLISSFFLFMHLLIQPFLFFWTMKNILNSVYCSHAFELNHHLFSDWGVRGCCKHILTFFWLNGFGSQTAKSGKSSPLIKSPSWMMISVLYLGSFISAFKAIVLMNFAGYMRKKKENRNKL